MRYDKNKTMNEQLDSVGLPIKESYSANEASLILQVRAIHKLVSAGFLDCGYPFSSTKDFYANATFPYEDLKDFFELTENYLERHDWLRATEAIRVVGLSSQHFYNLMASNTIRTSVNPVTYQTCYRTEDVVTLTKMRARA